MLPNFAPGSAPGLGQPIAPVDPVTAAWNTVAHFGSYEEAQAAVDRLSDAGFPVQELDIVGSDLQLIERVTGRLTTGRAAAAGAASGAWMGLFVGLLLSLFTSAHTAWFGLVLAAVVVGAIWGALLGFAAHAATRGRRDFASVRSIVAMRYDLIARGGTAERARTMLQQTQHGGDLPGQQWPSQGAG